jgi:hypothetical protein
MVISHSPDTVTIERQIVLNSDAGLKPENQIEQPVSGNWRLDYYN